MIPKVIHYCWFGRNALPKLALKCIESWKFFLPDYEIIEWNEDNFNLNLNRFTREAYDSKKYAFVSDVCRLYVLKKFGGIYMDTDVEILKPLDIFLHHTAFSGFENEEYVPTGIMGSQKDSKFMSDLLSYYDSRSFLIENGEFDTKPNTFIITEFMLEKGLKLDNTYQDFENFVTFYPKDYFCPKCYFTGKIEITNNSHAIHHFASSWLPKNKKIINRLKVILIKIFGERIFLSLDDKLRKI